MFSRPALDTQIWDLCRRVPRESCKDKCMRLSDRVVEKPVPPGESVPPSFQPCFGVPRELLARDKQSVPPPKPGCIGRVELWASPDLAPSACKGPETKDATRRVSTPIPVQSPFQLSSPFS